VIKDRDGEDMIYANASAKGMVLGLAPLSVFPIIFAWPLVQTVWFFYFILVVMAFYAVLHSFNIRPKDAVTGIKMFFIGRRRSFSSRRRIQRTMRGLRG
jgi:hypothetical protein